MAGLEAELHAARATAADAGPADEEAPGGRGSILAYVRNRPGTPSREVVLYDRGPLTHSGAKRVITGLLSTTARRNAPSAARTSGSTRHNKPVLLCAPQQVSARPLKGRPRRQGES
jgi:hypothetical protein